MKKLVFRSCAAIVALSSILFFACKKESARAEAAVSADKYVVNFIPAKTSNELIALRSNPKANILRSVADFDKIIGQGNSVFSKLTQSQIMDFRSSIVVRKDIGVVGLKYDPLSEQLSYDDFAAAMDMFGLDIKQGFWGLSRDPKVIAKFAGIDKLSADAQVRGSNKIIPFEDHPGYWCMQTPPHTCAIQSGHICLSGC